MLVAARSYWPGDPELSQPAVALLTEQGLTETAPSLLTLRPNRVPLAEMVQTGVPGVVQPLGEDWAEPEGLALLALFQTDDKQVASAVVLAEGYGAYRYGIGEWVAGEYLVRDIQPDHVVIHDSDRSFKLFLTPLTGGQGQTEAITTAQVDGVGLLDETRAQRERMRILGMYDLYPVMEGAAAGYVIGERFPRQVLEQVGLEPGSIILSVNGFAVGEPLGDEQALRSFQTTMKGAVVIQRKDGSTFTFNYPEDEQAP